MTHNKLIIFGAGTTGIEALRFYGKRNVHCFADNFRAGLIVDGKEVISIKELLKIKENYGIIVALFATNYYQVTKQLSELGIKFESYFEDFIRYGKTLVSSRLTEKVATLRNSCGGKKICLVGNGPSLRTQDLERLQLAGIETMACNLINKIFNKTDWRPDYYCCFEDSLIVQNKDYITNDIDTKLKFVKYSIQNEVKDFYNNYINELVIMFHYFNPEPQKYNDLYEDISNIIGTRYTVMYIMLKIALYCGYDEILLIGVDNTMPPTVHTKNFVGVKSHFYEEDADELEKRKAIMNSVTKLDNYYDFYQNELNRDYLRIKEYAENRGTKIINVTRGGRLDIFQRMDLDSYLVPERKPLISEPPIVNSMGYGD